MHDKLPELEKLGQHLEMWYRHRDTLPKRLYEFDGDEICALLGPDCAIVQADDKHLDGLSRS